MLLRLTAMPPLMVFCLTYYPSQLLYLHPISPSHPIDKILKRLVSQTDVTETASDLRNEAYVALA